jgi:Ni,Fe-hydrogenase I small subunit
MRLGGYGVTRCDLSAENATCPRCGFVSKVRGAIRGCTAPTTTTCGPGCQLSRTLSWFVRDDGTCGCTEYAAQMDSWGPDACEERLDEIVAHLLEQAAKRSIFLGAVPAAAVIPLVRRAIAAARAESTPATPPPG